MAFSLPKDTDPDAVYTPNERGYHTMTDIGERVPLDSEIVPRFTSS